MRTWQTWSGGAVWMLVATLMILAALQPVDVSAASPGQVHYVSFTVDCGTGLVMGCEGIRL